MLSRRGSKSHSYLSCLVVLPKLRRPVELIESNARTCGKNHLLEVMRICEKLLISLSVSPCLAYPTRHVLFGSSKLRHVIRSAEGEVRRGAGRQQIAAGMCGHGRVSWEGFAQLAFPASEGGIGLDFLPIFRRESKGMSSILLRKIFAFPFESLSYPQKHEGKGRRTAQHIIRVISSVNEKV